MSSTELASRLRAFLAPLRADRLTVTASLVAAMVLTVSSYHADVGEYQRLFGARFAPVGGLFAAPFAALHLAALHRLIAHATEPVADYLYWFLSSLVLFLAVPLVVLRLARLPLTGLGLGLGDWRFGLKAAALLYLTMLPFVVFASRSAAFAGSYPMCPGAATSVSSLAVYEASYLAYFAGWEFVYRGLLCNGLYPRIGAAAILLSTIPFAVMHAGKPEPEAYGAIVAGLALGALAVRARSFWYGALLHGAVAFTMDLLALGGSHRFPKIF